MIPSRNVTQANLLVVKLASLCDIIIEMCEKHDLPSEFQTHIKWIDVGNTCSRLVERLHIAHYYLINPKGNYISDGRLSGHKVLQKWVECTCIIINNSFSIFKNINETEMYIELFFVYHINKISC